MKDYAIIYVYDALCGWCYGFSPVMEKLYTTYKDKMDFTVLSGGMVNGDRVGPIGEVAGYISDAYKVVEERTGVKFGEGFLKLLRDGEAIFNSLPPGIALTVFKSEKPEQAVEFASRLQRAIYHEGIEPEDLEAYGKLAAEFNLDAQEFVNKMKSNEFKQATLQEFQKVSQWDISGFPSVIMATQEKLYLIAKGYVPYEQLEAAVQQVMTEKIEVE